MGTTLDSTARRCRGPSAGGDLPGRPAAGRTATGSDPHRGRLRHPHQARRLDQAGPGHRAGRDDLPGPAPEPADASSTCTSSAPNEACSRRRPSAAPTRSHSTFTPWDDAAARTDGDPVLHHRLGPRRERPVPSTPRPFNPGFSAASCGNTAGAHSPFSIDRGPRRRRPEPRPRCNVSTPPGLRGDAEGHPVLPGVRDRRRPAAAGYTGLAELASPACPAAEPGRHGRRRRRRRAPTRSTSPGKVYLAGPYKGAPLSLAGRRPRRLGPL